MWQALATELSDDGRGGGLDIIAIAVDERTDDVRPWIDGLTMPVLIDSDRVFCDLYGVTNVPTVVWIDEDSRIVRPNSPAFGDDTFKEFHGIDSAKHHDDLRGWVSGSWNAPSAADVAALRTAPTADEQAARTHFRLGVWLLRSGHTEHAAMQFARAGELAPDDFTIRRAAMPLVGIDPFGQEFFDLYEEWKDRTGGRYYPAD